MGKILNDRFYIVLTVISVIVVAVFTIRACTYQGVIYATVEPLVVDKGSPIAFSDSTKGAHSWLWEFGDGVSFAGQSGEHVFSETGKYQIRLTVNDKQSEKFIVEVINPKANDDVEIIKIIAPDNALQGEYITFRGVGASKEWRWEFGETGNVDAMEKTAIYKYEMPGIYTVSLRTEETKYPVLHSIEIIPRYMDNDSTDLASLIGNDIKCRLQAIVNREPFNKHYNYILTKYLCGNPNTLVIVNNNKKNDFYSYCQGLRIIGHKQTSIENVVVELDGNEHDEHACVKKMIVLQNDATP